MAGQPPGAFLFTDIVGSTRLWEDHTDAMQEDLAAHDDILRDAITRHDGVEFSTAGDSFAAAFPSPRAAASAAIEVQQALGGRRWTVPAGIGVRMGIHLGDAQRRAGSFYGPTLNQAARIMAAGHAGQIVVSGAVAQALDDLPLTPLGEHRLRDLDGTWALHQINVPGHHNAHPPLRSLGDHRSTLPVQRTSLIGREREIDRLGQAVREHRLVTLLGPGGVGKTRTAIETAGQAISRFPEGVLFVDLTRVADAAAVPGAFIDGIGRAAPAGRSVTEHLIQELGNRQVLLVVDNCEHVLDAAAGLVDDLLEAAPDLHVLATSRAVLDLEDEHIVVLPSLGEDPTVDPSSSPAVRLFIDRALAVDDTMVFDDASTSVISKIVERLDGMPLAIELAAARTRTLSPAQILDHLDDRFRLLVGRSRANRRQRTLEAAIAWSYDLLDEDEQETLRTLSVCAGALSLSTVARLLATDELAAADRIDSLVSKSLLTVVDTGGEHRGYRMLESLRAFGQDVLRARGELEAAHLAIERALLPPLEEIAADHLGFVNDQVIWSERTTLEASARREAGTHAMHAGRLHHAAHLFATATSPDEPGWHHRVLDHLAVLRDRIDRLDDPARRSVLGTQMQVESLIGAYDRSVATATAILADLGEDDPWRRFPEAWRAPILTLVDVHHVIVETDHLLPRATEQAGEPPDFSVSYMALARAVALQQDPARISEALEAARTAIRWATPGIATEFAVAGLLMMEHIAGLEHGPELDAALTAPVVETGLPLASIAAALAWDAPAHERARRLARLARRRPLGRWMHEESPYLVAFAWLAIEAGDLDRAETLLEAFVPRDPVSGAAGITALQRVHSARTGATLRSREVAGRYLSPEVHDRLADLAPGVLDAELAAWDRELGAPPGPGGAPGGR
jgi:predicted ATPase/class 3 adenylate cyclase